MIALSTDNIGDKNVKGGTILSPDVGIEATSALEA